MHSFTELLITEQTFDIFTMYLNGSCKWMELSQINKLKHSTEAIGCMEVLKVEASIQMRFKKHQQWQNQCHLQAVSGATIRNNTVTGCTKVTVALFTNTCGGIYITDPALSTIYCFSDMGVWHLYDCYPLEDWIGPYNNPSLCTNHQSDLSLFPNSNSITLQHIWLIDTPPNLLV